MVNVASRLNFTEHCVDNEQALVSSMITNVHEALAGFQFEQSLQEKDKFGDNIYIKFR